MAAETEKTKDRRIVQQDLMVDCYYFLKTCQQEREHYAEMQRGLLGGAAQQEQVPMR